MTDDLKRLLDIFSNATIYLVGREQNLQGLETALADIKGKSIPFTRTHLEIIRDKENKYWNFERFWTLPDINSLDFSELDRAIKNKSEKKGAIYILNSQIKNIEISSIIFRFIDPENYGIISSPVEKVLELKRGFSDEENYIYYLDNLKLIKDRYGFHKIAHVDMALFVYSIILEGIYSLEGERKAKEWAPQECIDIVKYHEKNVDIIKQIRAANLLSQIWNIESKLQMAALLIETDYHSAGLLASQDLERVVLDLCEKNRISTTWRQPKHFKKLTSELEFHGIIGRDMRYELDKAWDTRAICVHIKEQDQRKSLTKERVEHIIELLGKLYDI
ncbi:TPA: hypothetical protein ENX78_05030 [Candidatus Poribacteria bacterium]|nr:hypothetical protein [Candidatus Poribacteria bacterium]